MKPINILALLYITGYVWSDTEWPDAYTEQALEQFLEG